MICRYEYFCPKVENHNNGTYSCEWNKHDPPYKPNEKRYHFKMNGTNVLNKTGVLWFYQMDHYAMGMMMLFDFISSSLGF